MSSTKKPNKSSELEFWIAYSVILGILPLALVFAFSSSPKPFFDLLSNGELFVVSLSLSGERLGHMFVRQRGAGSRSFFIFLITGFAAVFGIASVGHLDAGRVIVLSVIIFVPTVIIGIVILWGK